MLGTIVEITVPEAASGKIDLAFDAIAHVHRCMSFHEPGSDLNRINVAPAGRPIEVDGALVDVFRIAAMLFERTDGHFDVTRGRALVRDGFLPKLDGLEPDRCDGDASDIEIVDDTHVRCNRKVLIDLGGIAKGYAVDRAVEALKAAGVGWGIVNAGGDLRVFGIPERVVYVRAASGGEMASLALRDAALASSSNVDTRIMTDGREAAPHIGRDGQAVLIDGTVSVVAATCVIADAMTKVAMTDPDLADAVLADHQGSVVRLPAELAA